MKPQPAGPLRKCTFEGCDIFVSRGERCHKHDGRRIQQRRSAAQEKLEIAQAMRGLTIDTDDEGANR